jgi:hypothetical protein
MDAHADPYNDSVVRVEVVDTLELAPTFLLAHVRSELDGDTREHGFETRRWAEGSGPFRHDDRSSVQASRFHSGIRVQSAVQREGGDFGPQKSSGTEIQDFDQFGTAAPVRGLNGHLVGNRKKRYR